MSEMFWYNPFVGDSAPEPILRDVFTGWNLGTGIFSYLSSQTTLPWAQDSDVDSDVLDIAYFGNHSGGKFCSPLVKSLLNDDEEVPSAARVVIAKILISKYLPNWNHLWETNKVAYSPIHNYDMTENRSLKKANSEAESGSEIQSHTGTDTLQHGKVETTEHGKVTDGIDYRYGINTEEDPRPSDSSNVAESGETSVTDSGSDVQTKNLADSSTTNKSRVGADEEDEVIHRAGNIGVTTTQKLLQEERNLWIWNFFDQVFRDLDNELALAFHDMCRV